MYAFYSTRHDTHIPWANPKLNLSEIDNRFASSWRHDVISAYSIHRLWVTYLWGERGMATYHAPCFNERWSTLVGGRVYCVVFVDSQDNKVKAANVLKFRRYIRVTDDIVEDRTANVTTKIEAIQTLLDLFENEYPYMDVTEDDLDSLILSFKECRSMAFYAMLFEDMSGRKHTIDPCAFECGAIDIMPLNSNGYCIKSRESEYVNNNRVYYETDRDAAARSLNKLRLLWARRVIEDVAATTIQRAWKRARSNPKFSLCKKRLREEFEDDLRVD